MDRHISSHIIQDETRAITPQLFFQTLYQHCDGQGCLELRQLPSRRQVFLPWSQDDLEKRIAYLTHENVYFGVAPRKDSSSGELANCLELSAFFVDIDFKNSSEQEARDELARFPLQPSAVIHSGGGLHAYWFLKEPFSLLDETGQRTAKSYLRRLAQAVRGDLASAEPAHILRVPGSMNHKYDPPRLVEVETLADSLVYDLLDFDGWLPEEITPTPQQHTGGGRVNPGRNNHLTSLAGSMRRRGMSQPAIEAALLAENPLIYDTPLPEDEVISIAKSIMRYSPMTCPVADTPAPFPFETLPPVLKHLTDESQPHTDRRGTVSPG